MSVELCKYISAKFRDSIPPQAIQNLWVLLRTSLRQEAFRQQALQARPVRLVQLEPGLNFRNPDDIEV